MMMPEDKNPFSGIVHFIMGMTYFSVAVKVLAILPAAAVLWWTMRMDVALLVGLAAGIGLAPTALGLLGVDLERRE